MSQIRGLNIYLKLFQYCGFTFRSETLLKASQWRFQIIKISPVIFGLILSIIELYLLYIFRETSFHKTTLIGYLTGVLEVISPIFTGIILMLENLYFHQLEMKIWKITERIDRAVARMRIAPKPTGNGLTFEQNFQLKFFIAFGIGFAMDTYVLASVSHFDPGWARTIMFSLRSVTCARIGMLQVVLFVEWTVHRCYSIQKCILATIKSNPHEQHRNIKKMGTIYSDLWLLVQLLNTRFGAGLLATIINCFLCITISLYWIITRIKFKKFHMRTSDASNLMEHFYL